METSSIPPEPSHRHARFERFEELIEIPMLVLSVALVPVLLMPVIEDLSPWSERILWWTGSLIWLAFVVEYIALVYLSPHRFKTMRSRKLDLALIALPILRPLRLARLLRLATAGTAAARMAVAAGRLLGRPGFGPTLGIVGGCILIGGVLVSVAENKQEGATISGLTDGIWWAFVTCTTVGYGDEFPVTGSGRVLAVVLMLIGISALSVITANVAAFFVSGDVEDETDDIDERLDRIESQLLQLTDLLSASLSGIEQKRKS
ncbi:MAG: potassium channel family protein [Actinomycetota bacterium]